MCFLDGKTLLLFYLQIRWFSKLTIFEIPAKCHTYSLKGKANVGNTLPKHKIVAKIKWEILFFHARGNRI